MTDQRAGEFNSMYQRACDRMKGIILLDDYRPRALGFFGKIRARNAINYFEKVLAIFPEHPQSLFFLGKIYQMLKDYERALFYLDNAVRLERTNHNLPLEASLVAMHLQQTDKAIEYSREALRRKPDDVATLGNFSMNLLIGGFDQEAREAIDKAMSIDATDSINKRIKAMVDGVIAGQRHRPTFKECIG